jgi:hypothetical protein
MDVALACWQCGTPVTNARFCTACGAPQNAGDPTQAVPGVEAAFAPAAPPAGWYDQAPPGYVAGTDTAVYGGGAPLGPLGPPPPWAPAYPPPVQDPRAAPRVRHPWRAVLAVLVVAALGLSCWVLMHGGERHVLSGTVLLTDSSVSDLDPGDSCRGTGGYSDINAGAQVVLTDGNGTTLSTTVLSSGEFDGRGCVFAFELRDVRHADYYRLAVAGTNRGQLQYSYGELAGDSWSVQLSLGEN